MIYKPFSVVGIELEHMIVDARSYQISSIAPLLLGTTQHPENADAQHGYITWSNELVSHVIEMKTTSPVPNVWAAEKSFQESVQLANTILGEQGACLLSCGMHPTMNSSTEGVLWSGEGKEIYQRYKQIFNVQQHGWKNVQSIHVNLPFDSDESFVRLHTAVRVLLPILPALCAASPFIDGKKSENLDSRLFAYRSHQTLLPQTMGAVIPDDVSSEQEYQQTILDPIANAIAPYNADQLLNPLYLNARGAIARFDRQAIEIRLIDAQECVGSSLAIADIVFHVVESLANEHFSPLHAFSSIQTAELAALLWETARSGEHTVIHSDEYLSLFGLSKSVSAKDLWLHLISQCEGNLSSQSHEFIDVYTHQGTLASRMLQSRSFESLCSSLCSCLAMNTLLQA